MPLWRPFARFCSLPLWLLRSLADPTNALALERPLNQGIDSGNVADQFLRDQVAIPQVVGTGRTHPYPIILPLPDEYFEGQIKCEKWRSNHQRSAGFRVAKDQHMGLLHREADSLLLHYGQYGQRGSDFGCVWPPGAPVMALCE